MEATADSVSEKTRTERRPKLASIARSKSCICLFGSITTTVFLALAGLLFVTLEFILHIPFLETRATQLQNNALDRQPILDGMIPFRTPPMAPVNFSNLPVQKNPFNLAILSLKSNSIVLRKIVNFTGKFLPLSSKYFLRTYPRYSQFSTIFSDLGHTQPLHMVNSSYLVLDLIPKSALFLAGYIVSFGVCFFCRFDQPR